MRGVTGDFLGLNPSFSLEDDAPGGPEYMECAWFDDGRT